MKFPRRFLCLLATAAFWTLCGSTVLFAAEPDPAQLEFFEKRVRPVFVMHCQKCHGGEKAENGLRVDSLAALVRGGDTGPALVPGKPEASLLVSAINHGEIVQMPPKTKLPATVIADLTAWVKMGAPWPAAQAVPLPPVTSEKQPLFTAEQKAYWAFQVPVAPAIPSVKGTDWCQSPIDAFVLAGLEAKRLSPAPPADKRTLIRRATFDLIGLPPAPAEVEAFVNDDSPEAFARVVDRLLASAHYGERWGRHWLDVARYADSNGMDENVAYANAFRYRDYVVASLNRDKPYDQFVREQIAGDLLADPADPVLSAERLTGTGFLVIGPKMLAEDDPLKMEMDIVDEQLDTVGRTFLGLTLGCARCHDHKFDPIPTADYYSLAAIFKSTQTMQNFKVVAMWHERSIASPQQTAAREQALAIVKVKKGELEQLTKSAREAFQELAQSQADQYLAAATTFLQTKPMVLQPLMNGADAERIAGLILLEAEKFERGNVKRDFTDYGAKIGVVYNAGELPNFTEHDFTLAEAGGYQLELRYAAAESRPITISLDGKPLRSAAAGKVTGSWQPDTQTWVAESLVQITAGKHTLRLHRDGPFPHIDKLALVPRTLSEGFENVEPQTLEQVAREKSLNLGLLRQWMAYLEKCAGKPIPPLAEIVQDPKGPLTIPKDAEQFYAAATITELKRLREEVAVAEKGIPALPMVMGASEGKITNLKIHLRGNYLTQDREVPRQFPQIIAGEQQTPVGGTTSGRLQLAEWIANPKNPLASRVLVNRVWHWHFGQGLVRSPDNFGRLGEAPDHPALLDFLAIQFVDQGWSLKSLHRAMMLSSTYQMSSTHHHEGARLDPENRWLWRHERRRLEAEALRDGILAVSGELNTAQGGSLLGVENHRYVTSTASERYDPYHVPRRSIYLPITRSSVYDLFQAFDFADPSTANGQRASTTIAPQALALMNSRLVEEQTRKWSQRLLDIAGDDGDRVRLIYAQAYSRPPSAAEVTRSLEFIQRIETNFRDQQQSPADARWRAWQSLCRVTLASSEFVYVE